MLDLKKLFQEVYETLLLNFSSLKNNLEIAVGTQNAKLGYKLARSGGGNLLGRHPDSNNFRPNINIVDYSNQYPNDNYLNLNSPNYSNQNQNYSNQNQNFNNMNNTPVNYPNQMYSPNHSYQYVGSYPDFQNYNESPNYWNR